MNYDFKISESLMMLSAGLCSPHVIRSVLLINQWESNSYFRDPELTNEKRNVRSLLSPAMNMFVIIIWLKTADPPEHEDSLLWDISVGLHNKEPSEGVVCSVDQARYNWDTDVAQPGIDWSSSENKLRTILSVSLLTFWHQALPLSSLVWVSNIFWF